MTSVCGEKVGLAAVFARLRAGHSSTARRTPSPILRTAHASAAAAHARRAACLGLLGALAVCGARGVASVAASGPTCTPATLDGSALARRRRDGLADAGGRDAAAADADQLPRASPPQALSAVSGRSARSAAPTPGALRGLLAGRRRQLRAARAVPARRARARHARSWRRRRRTAATELPVHGRASPTGSRARPRQSHAVRLRRSAQHFVSRPDLQPPVVTVHRTLAAAGAGRHLPRALRRRRAQAGPMIIDPAGRLVWFKPLARPDRRDEPPRPAARRQRRC